MCEGKRKSHLNVLAMGVYMKLHYPQDLKEDFIGTGEMAQEFRGLDLIPSTPMASHNCP